MPIKKEDPVIKIDPLELHDDREKKIFSALLHDLSVNKQVDFSNKDSANKDEKMLVTQEDIATIRDPNSAEKTIQVQLTRPMLRVKMDADDKQLFWGLPRTYDQTNKNDIILDKLMLIKPSRDRASAMTILSKEDFFEKEQLSVPRRLNAHFVNLIPFISSAMQWSDKRTPANKDTRKTFLSQNAKVSNQSFLAGKKPNTPPEGEERKTTLTIGNKRGGKGT